MVVDLSSARPDRGRAAWVALTMASRPQSSPIGLGHARRDVAIAKAIKQRHPAVEVDWLAQHPVTRVLQAAGERLHPASRYLASESQHIEGESGEHDLHLLRGTRAVERGAGQQLPGL